MLLRHTTSCCVGFGYSIKKDPRPPLFSHSQLFSSNLLETSRPRNSKMASTSSSATVTTMVTLYHYDFQIEMLHMWWHFLSIAEQVRIKDDFGRVTSLLTLQVNWDLIQALTSFWDPA